MLTKSAQNMLCIALIFWFMPAVSSAAEISFGGVSETVATGEEAVVQVFLDTQGASVNAVGGALSFPADLLELEEIRDGNSSVNIWIEKPKLAGPGSIVFSGITAGGFSGPRNLLFMGVFRAVRPGSASFGFSDVSVLKSDGAGTTVPTSSKPLVLAVRPTDGAGPLGRVVPADNEPPETFVPYIGNDPSIYLGKHFVAFAAQDKGSGIDHYEVREGYFGRFHEAESPYVLDDQTLTKRIFVRAVDKNGNTVVVSLYGRARHSYQYYLIGGILLIFCAFIFRKRWSNLIQR